MSKLLVVGDVMLDEYHWGTVDRLSPEAPVPVLNVHTTECRAGGAANVALNLRAMGADVHLCTLLGYNLDDYQTLQGLVGLPITHAWSPAQTTTRKVRGMAGKTQLFRYDHDMRPDATAAAQLTKLVLPLLADYDLIVFSDYGKGALRYVDELLARCVQLKKPTVVDPKGTDWTHYTGATYIKPNHKEWLAATNVPTDSIIIETRQGAGAHIYQRGRMVPKHVPGLLVPCVDPTGAGDSFLAQFALRMADDDLRVVHAVTCANAAGAVAVQHAGTHIVTKEEVDHAIRSATKPA